MTDNQYMWIGIIGQGVPLLTAVYLVTVGNWMIKRRERKVLEEKIDWDEEYEVDWDNH